MLRAKKQIVSVDILVLGFVGNRAHNCAGCVMRRRWKQLFLAMKIKKMQGKFGV
jgi:hypothetical protein